MMEEEELWEYLPKSVFALRTYRETALEGNFAIPGKRGEGRGLIRRAPLLKLGSYIQPSLQAGEYMALNSFLRILPVAVRGRASAKTTFLGILYLANLP